MKFKHKFLLPTKDFKKWTTEELWVETTTDDFTNIQDVIYKVKIPDYIFDELADTEPRFTTKSDINNREIFGRFVNTINSPVFRKFQKTQSSVLLSDLRDMFQELANILDAKHSDEYFSKTKKIFIRYDYKSNHSTNRYNAAYTGKVITNHFQYFIGYEYETNPDFNKDGRLYAPPVKKYITHIEYYADGASLRKRDTGFKEIDDRQIDLCGSLSLKEFELVYSIIDWTEEREAFCKHIQDMFETVNEKLGVFLHDLNNEKFQLLMQNNPLKLLTDGK